MSDFRLLAGDCREVMAGLPADSVHCAVTSPPYWGLRDYGDPGQLGLESTPEEYVANMVSVFRAVRRVLRADGTVWLNIGDSYHSGNRGGYRNDSHRWEGSPLQSTTKGTHMERVSPNRLPQDGLKPKDLVGIPWRVAFALRADGWWLRSDIIWSKPNPMPESVTDRPTSAHEYLFLLAKSERYFYDATAIAEPVSESTVDRLSQPGLADQSGSARANGGAKTNGPMKAVGTTATRNKRSVWRITTQPYSEAHFATFPPKLVEPCILAGTSQKGCCPECGAPWERVVERTVATIGQRFYAGAGQHGKDGRRILPDRPGQFVGGSTETTGWRPTCDHDADPIPCTVLDPFCGSGTTGMVALGHGRRFVGIDLKYQEMARQRIGPMFEAPTT